MNKVKVFAREIRNKLRGFISVHWSNSANWGDALNVYLVEKISGQTVKFEASRQGHHYLVIGSIIERATKKSVIWGTGAMSADLHMLDKPTKVCAVRGPETRKLLLQNNIECPEIYGDPALLLPKYYKPNVQNECAIGIIPHYSDKAHPWIKAMSMNDGVRVINIEQGIQPFVDAVLSCRRVFSSSLHGIICADAYGIPSRQISLYGDRVIGGQFKFNDYNHSVRRILLPPLEITTSTAMKDLLVAKMNGPIAFDPGPLLEACPFLKR
jgi:pyruvyltransferase